MKRHFYNFPRKLTHEAYVSSCEHIVELAKKDQSVVSVYLLGAEWVPGVSDMDIIVVYANDTRRATLPGPWGINSTMDYVFTHGYFSFVERDFISYHHLFPKETAHIRCLWGKKLKVADPEEKLGTREYHRLLSFILFDFYINKLLLFPRYRSQQSVNIRQVLGELYSLTYLCTLIKKVTGQSLGADFIKRITFVKYHWFEETEAHRLAELQDLLGGGIELVLESLSVFTSWLEKEYGEVSPTIRFFNKRFDVRSTFIWTPDDFLKHYTSERVEFTFLGRHIENDVLVVPKAMGMFMQAYANGDGSFSTLVRSSCDGLQTTSEIPQNLRTHVEVVNKVFTSSAERGGSFKIPFPHGFSYRGHYSFIDNIVILMVRAFRFIKMI